MLGLGVAAVATVTAGTALAPAPAQALMLGSSISLSGAATVTEDSITFLNSKVDTASLSFTSLINSTAAQIKPLNFSPSLSGASFAVRSTGAISQFINFGSFTDENGVTGNLSFNLNPSNVLTTSFPGLGVNHSAFPFLQGVFEFNGTTVAGGFLNASRSGTSSSYDISLVTTSATQAVPTPALLPGLLALGAGVLRKRKAEAAEEVKANA